MIRRRAGSAFTRMLEGSSIALDSIRANKVRAALTILGVAIGVTVVIAMASAPALLRPTPRLSLPNRMFRN